MSYSDLLKHVHQLAKLFVEFLKHNLKSLNLEAALHVHAEFHILEDQSVKWGIPSNASAYTFVSGLAVTMDSCAAWCASQA